MKKLSSILFLFCIYGQAGCAAENNHFGRGTEGLSIIPVTLTNSGNTPLLCSVSTAHWYSVALGDIQQGKTLHFSLWKNIRSGEVFVLNARQDQLPVQTLWCGASDNAYESRQQLALPDRRNGVPQPIALHCAALNGRVHCQPVPRLAG